MVLVVCDSGSRVDTNVVSISTQGPALSVGSKRSSRCCYRFVLVLVLVLHVVVRLWSSFRHEERVLVGATARLLAARIT